MNLNDLRYDPDTKVVPFDDPPADDVKVVEADESKEEYEWDDSEVSLTAALLILKDVDELLENLLTDPRARIPKYLMDKLSPTYHEVNGFLDEFEMTAD